MTRGAGIGQAAVGGTGTRARNGVSSKVVQSLPYDTDFGFSSAPSSFFNAISQSSTTKR